MEQHLLVELEEVFGQMFRKKNQEWGKHVESEISGSQALILLELKNRGQLRPSDLADALSITSGAVTSLCDKLISVGYAMRSRAEEDRRVVNLHITPSGLKALEAITQLRREMIKRLYDGLSTEDIRHLIRIYKLVLNNANNKES